MKEHGASLLSKLGFFYMPQVWFRVLWVLVACSDIMKLPVGEDGHPVLAAWHVPSKHPACQIALFCSLSSGWGTFGVAWSPASAWWTSIPSKRILKCVQNWLWNWVGPSSGGTNCYLELHYDGLTGLAVFGLFVIKSDGDNKNRTKNDVKSE